MSNINVLPKEGDIDGNGRRYVYGHWWEPWVIPMGKENRILPLPQYQIDLICYGALTYNKRPPPGVESRASHFKKVASSIWGDPEGVWFFEWNPNADRILEAKLKHKFVTVPGHGSSGKTEAGVVWAFVNWLLDPRDTKVLITSLTLKSARGKVWGSVTEAWQQFERFRRKIFGVPDHVKVNGLVPGKLLAQGMIRYDYMGVSTEKAGMELIPGDTDKAAESAEKVQGYKRGHIIAILDELASLDHALMTTVENNLFTNWDCDVLGLFNPDSFFDPGGKYSTPIDGYASLKGDERGWKTPWGWCENLRGSTSPNVVAKERIWRGLLTYESYSAKLEKSGREDKEFCKMFEGNFSAAGSVDCIFDEGTIINSQADKPIDPKLWVERPVPVGFFDPSFAHGGDRAILYKGRCGRIKLPDGRLMKAVCLAGEKKADGSRDAPYIRLDKDIDPSKGKDEQIIANLIRELNKAGISVENFGMDVSGAGSSLYTILSFRLQGANRILQCNFGATASDRPTVANDGVTCKERYARLVSEIWYEPKALIMSGQVRGLHPDLIVEMTNRRYEEHGGRVAVESKEEMKARTLKSPDIGDSGLGVVHVCRIRLGLTCIEKAPRASSKSRSSTTMQDVARKCNAFNGASTASSSKGAVLWRR